MSEIKVKIDSPAPDREMIRKYKNFDRFMDRYRRYYSTRGIREMLYNDKRKLIYIVIILLTILLLLISYDESNGEVTDSSKYETDHQLHWKVRSKVHFDLITEEPETLANCDERRPNS